MKSMVENAYHQITLSNTSEYLEKTRIFIAERPLGRTIGENGYISIVNSEGTRFEPSSFSAHVPAKLAGDPLAPSCPFTSGEVFSDYRAELDSTVDVSFYGEESLQWEVYWIEAGFAYL
ncbi:uncharacterized protein N7496_009916 [Penicillium cataractarum]|uniref:Uncharacterized protein n=1 Tax=Penicillium cataractarum TaxID=2100454 RepID=A0A9W9RPV5_9EURO|nr:uncharacterized protein N7496_009916 [Penicillium cataractarum]KAJ5364203.1 hypothetical protein N7496_009916 [Penicillium cataractarum]